MRQHIIVPITQSSSTDDKGSISEMSIENLRCQPGNRQAEKWLIHWLQPGVNVNYSRKTYPFYQFYLIK